MNQPITKSCLSAAQNHLVELFQMLNFGRIEALRVSGGEPVFDPPPRIIQKVKIGGENGPRPENSYGDFRLKQGLIELLEVISRLGEGEIQAIEVRYGLPCTLEIERKQDAPADTVLPSPDRDRNGGIR